MSEENICFLFFTDEIDVAARAGGDVGETVLLLIGALLRNKKLNYFN